MANRRPSIPTAGLAASHNKPPCRRLSHANDRSTCPGGDHDSGRAKWDYGYASSQHYLQLQCRVGTMCGGLLHRSPPLRTTEDSTVARKEPHTPNPALYVSSIYLAARPHYCSPSTSRPDTCRSG